MAATVLSNVVHISASLMVAVLFSAPLGAQTTSGTASTGQTLYEANCDSAGCHGATPGTANLPIKNAANAGGIINSAMSNSMGGFSAASFTATQENDIAAYIATVVTQSANPANSAVTHNSAGTLITLPNIYAGTSYGPITRGIQCTSGGSCVNNSRGTVTFSTSGTSIRATYVPSTGQCGSDTVWFRGANAAGTVTTMERRFSVDIADPSAPNITTSASAKTGTYNTAMTAYTPTSTGGTPYSYAISVGTLPTGLSLNTSTGAITGTPTQTGVINVTLQARNCFNGSLTGQSSTRTIAFTISQASQAALTGLVAASSAPPAFTYSSPSGTAAMTTSGGSGTGAVSYSSNNTAVCTVSGSTLTLVGAGSCTLTATKAADTNYLVASDTVSVTVNKANQAALTGLAGGSATPSTFTYQFPNGTSALTTSGGSGTGAVSYSSDNTSVCTVSGSTLTLAGAGTCNVTATKAADTNYNVATDTIPITVNSTAPTAPTGIGGTAGDQQVSVTFTAPTNTGGAPPLSYTASCSASGQTTRTKSGSSSPLLVGGAGALMTNGVIYACSVTATNANTQTSSASSSVNLTPTATPVAPSISSANNTTFTVLSAGNFQVTATGTPSTFTYAFSGTPPSGVTFNTGTGLFSGTPAAGTVGSYPGTLTVSNTTMPNATQSFTLTVQKASQSISFSAPADRAMRPVPFTISGTATSGLTVAFTIAPASASICSVAGTTLTMLSVGTCTINADQPGNANYNAAVQTAKAFAISQGTQTIVFNAQGARTYSPSGTFSLSPVSASVDSTDLTTSTGLTVTNTSLTSDVCTIAGTTVTIVTAGICSIQASQAGNANYSSASAVMQTITINQASQAISWGAQSNQSFGTGGTFAISPTATGGASGNSIVYGSSTTSVCTVSGTTVTKVSSGTCTLTANQAGDDNYTAASQVSRSLSITASTPTAPTATDIMASDGQIYISFDPPSSDGGSAITNYRATCLPGPIFNDGTTSPLKVPGLTNGVNYTCGVRAQNSAGFGTASNTLMATPFLETGTNTWTNVCSGCHGAQPAGVRFNAAGTTGNVLNYVRSVQSQMLSTGAVQMLTLNELAEVAKYIETFVPSISMNTAFNTPVNVDVSSHLTLGTISFETAEVVAGPLNGSLGTFSGTTITYTPTPGYVGSDTFTYRGNHSAPGVPGDAHTVTINIAAPPVPVITSSAIFSGVFGTPTSYQITATNSPTSYGATPLGAGFGVDTNTGLISGTPNAAGSFTVTVSATNAGGTGMQSVDITVSKASQSITFAAQGGQTYSQGGTFMLSPTASASSLLAVTYSSLTTGVCTISGTTVTIVTAGTCTIAADQSGNANYNAALQVTRGIAIAATVPGAPTIGTATPGDTTASIGFTAPTNNGGSPITSYGVRCLPGPVTGTGTASPITVTGLLNSTLYTCDVRATNAAGNGAFSSTVTVTPTATPVAPQIVSANATTFTVSTLGNFTVSATGVPAPTLSVAMGLPSGVTFTPASGALAGTPALGTVGSYPVTFTATDPSAQNGPAMQSFTLTVQKASQSISFTGPASQAFSPSTIPLSATATSGLTVTFASNTTSVCTVSGTTLTLITVGTCSITASQAGDANYNAATDVTQGFSVTQASQTITFAAQVPSSRNFLAGSTFSVSPTASSSSGLPISYSSTTGSICTVVGTTVTMVAPGTCTIAANQSGSANYTAATQVTRSVALNATVPGAPTIGAATPGNTQASIAFTAPSNNGGSAITTYTASCTPGPITGPGSGSPIVVTGLTNNVVYSCTVTATNGVGTGAASASVNVTPLSGQGITTWTNVCSFCHGSTPSGNQLNVAGTTSTVLDYVRSHQSLMLIFPSVQNLSLSELADVAAYIATEIPANEVTTSLNTPVQVNVNNHITLTGTAWASFDSVELVTPPANGGVGAFTGTVATYTPTNGYLGADSFTYRGKLNSIHVGDPQTVWIMVNPAAPSITSSTGATGTFDQIFSYQITASNTPTSFAAVGLPGGLTVDTNTGLISGTPTTAGSFDIAISATNAGGFGQATLMLSIDAAPQTITFPAQTTATRSWSSGGTFTIAPIATGGASLNPIVYGSNSIAVCTVSGTTVTILTAGTCIISADQAGNTDYAAAAQATANVTINAIAPGAPVIGTATAGNAQATITFTAPSSNGGSAITDYTATCNVGGITRTGTSSPIIVTGLVNGTTYNCSVTATNAAALTGSASSTVMVTPVSIVFIPPAVSRKTHGGTDRDLTIAAGLITDPVTVEPRNIGAGHKVVFKFNNPVTSVTSVTVTDASSAPIGSATASFPGNNELVVTITGIPDGTRVTVTVTGANGAVGVDASAALGFLVGDVTNKHSVNAADISAIKARQSQLVTSDAMAVFDIDVSGTVDNADVTTVKAKSGRVLP